MKKLKSVICTENVWHNSVQNPVSFLLSSKNIKIETYRTIIVPPTLYECKAWSLTLREAYKLRVCESGMPRRIFEPKREQVTGRRETTAF